MSNEPDERDVEALAAVLLVPSRSLDLRRQDARVVLASDWLAERDAQQRAEALRVSAEAVEGGPMVVNGLAHDASRTAFLAKWLRDRAERQRPAGLESTRPTHPGG